MLEKVPKNEKPQERVATQSQGARSNANGNSTTNGQLKDSRSRYEKGLELYKEGKVKLGSNGLFKVSGYYEADIERMTCTCPDYKTRKESCKHLFAAMLFVKNKGKQTIEHLEGQGKEIVSRVQQSNGKEQSWVDEMMNAETPKPEAKEPANKPFDRQATITRLAVLNTATEILKTHRKPIEFSDIVSLAAQLEKWALSK